MNTLMKILGFYIILIISMAYGVNAIYPNSYGKEIGVLIGLLLSALLWNQYGREMVKNAND
jgi:hypothetical protein